MSAYNDALPVQQLAEILALADRQGGALLLDQSWEEGHRWSAEYWNPEPQRDLVIGYGRSPAEALWALHGRLTKRGDLDGTPA